MSTPENKSINFEDLKKELTALSFADLKEEFITLRIEHVWKGGVKKEVLINAGIEALKEAQENQKVEETKNPETQNSVEGDVRKEGVIEFQFQEGETVLEQRHFDLIPGLEGAGFSIGDTLISEAGKPLFKKVDVEAAEELLNDERLQKVIERAKELGIETEGLDEDDLYEAILDAETLLQPESLEPVVEDEDQEEIENIEVEAEVVEEIVIDETLFTEEEIQENIEIVQANLHQAIPSTRIFLLRKADALEAALQRKRQ